MIATAKPLPNQFVDIIANIHELDSDDVPCLESRSPDEVIAANLEQQEFNYEELKLVDEPAVNEILQLASRKQAPRSGNDAGSR